MTSRKLFIGFCIFAVMCSVGACLFNFKNNHSHNQLEQLKESEKSSQSAKADIAPVTDKNSAVNIQAKKADLYSDYSYEVPLISITEIAKLSPIIKMKADVILEKSQGFFFFKQNPETQEVRALLYNPINNLNRYNRHNLQIVHISNNGSVSYSNIGYAGSDNEIDNAVIKTSDEWIYDDNENMLPIKHVAYDKNKKIDYIETWNYSEENPIKYKMQDSEGRVISIMKETPEVDSDFRQAHIFYDDEGHTKISVTASYSGSDLKRFTYYDSDNLQDSMTIENVYKNGLKIQENLYNANYQLVNTIKSIYKDGERAEILIFDSNNKEICRFEKE